MHFDVVGGTDKKLNVTIDSFQKNSLRISRGDLDYVDSTRASVNEFIDKKEKTLLIVISNGSAFVFSRSKPMIDKTGSPHLAKEEFLFDTSFIAASWLEESAVYLCNPSEFLGGYVERVSEGYVRGWVINLLSRDMPQVGLYIGHHLYRVDTPSKFRSDIVAFGSEAAAQEFSIALPQMTPTSQRDLFVKFIEFDYNLAWNRVNPDEANWIEKAWASAKQRSGFGLAFEFKRAAIRIDEPFVPPFKIKRIHVQLSNAVNVEAFLSSISLTDRSLLANADCVTFLVSRSFSRDILGQVTDFLRRLTLIRGNTRLTEARLSAGFEDEDAVSVVLDEILPPYSISSVGIRSISHDLTWSKLFAYRSSLLYRDQTAETRSSELLRLTESLSSTICVVASVKRDDLESSSVIASRASAVFDFPIVKLQFTELGYFLTLNNKEIRTVECKEPCAFSYCIRALICELYWASQDMLRENSPVRTDGVALILSISRALLKMPSFNEALECFHFLEEGIANESEYLFYKVTEGAATSSVALDFARLHELDWIFERTTGIQNEFDETLKHFELCA